MKHIIIPAAILALGACSNTNVKTANVAPPLVANVASYEYKANVVKDQVGTIPKWFTQMPKDDRSIFAVGTSQTPDLQLSVDMATMSAKTTLADRINGRVSSQAKSFISKIGSDETDTAILSEIEKVTKNLIADVDVAGYHVAESKIVSSGTQYRAFVLLEYSDLQAQKILLNRLRKDRMLMSKISSTTAFRELDNAVKIAGNKVAKKDAQDAELLSQAITGGKKDE
jgi:hypothetical protein|tara:strand:- start:1482 stop:2162 length:681 start_codon:yes stop_codon:yes gene_type:complete